MSNVVIIADRTAQRDVLARLARSVAEDTQVASFSSLDQAWDHFSVEAPALVIIDFSEPDLTGTEFVRAFRALPDLSETPIMVVAAPEHRGDCYQLLEVGATDFLLGEVDQPEFKIRVQNLLKLGEQQRMLRANVGIRDKSTNAFTDLSNRDAFQSRSENALAGALRRQARCALLLLDLDRFKGVNDAFGLAVGDLLLRDVAKRLARYPAENDVIGHLGGDQFAILQMDVSCLEESRRLAKQVKESFRDPFMIDGEELHISASIGITMFPADGYRVEQLLKNAEFAKCRAKAIGRNAVHVYVPRMNFLARRTGLLERDLRRAIADDQFTVYYQPCRAVSDDRILGMEALLRWRHPRRGIVRPTEFIGLAETIGLINAITECVLDQSCRQHRSWTGRGLPPLRLAVNLSPIQFREEGVVDLVRRLIERTGIAPEILEIELTEGVMIENSKVAMDSLAQLNDLGVTFSLDDFGTGYSSLSYIRRLPVQRLKIDRSFVHRLGRDGQDDAIVRAVIDLGHSLGLSITAEGVETHQQLDRLKALGCDEVQGDLISPPLSADVFETLFTKPTCCV